MRKKNNLGIAHPLFIVLAVIVLAAVGFAAWKVFGNKDDTKTVTNSNGQRVEVSTSASEKACNNALHDKTFCKFASHYDESASFKMVNTTTGSSGTSVMTMESDGKNNTKMVMSQNGKETMSYISLNGDTYSKDESSGTWIKYPKSSTSTDPTSDISSSIKVDTNSWTENNTVSYKASGKEQCGHLTCYKYQMLDTKNTSTQQYLWFDDKDYVLRRWMTVDSSGTNDMTITYQSVTITAPSPVVDYSAQSGAAAAAAAAAAAGFSQ